MRGPVMLSVANEVGTVDAAMGAGEVSVVVGSGGDCVVVVGGWDLSAFVSVPFADLGFVAPSVKLSFWRLLGKHMRDYESGRQKE